MPTYAHIQTDQTDAWYRVLKDSDLEHPEKGVDAYLYLDDLADMHRTALIQRLYGSPEMAEIMLDQMIILKIRSKLKRHSTSIKSAVSIPIQLTTKS